MTTKCALKGALLASLAVLTKSYIPDGKEGWEPVHKYRARNGIEFNFEPRFISPEMCRYLTEEECQREDDGARNTFEAEAAFRSRRDLAQSILPAVKPLILLVRFKDHEDRELPPASHFQALCDGASGPGTINPIGNIMDYFNQQSGGRFALSPEGCTVVDWKTSTMTEVEAARGQSGLLGSAESQKFFHNVLDEYQAEKIAEFGEFFWPLSGFDSDGVESPDAGFLDALVVIHSGLAAQEGGTECSGVNEQNRIWSQGHVMSEGQGWVGDKIEVGGYSISSAFENCDPQGPATTMGVVTHEW